MSRVLIVDDEPGIVLALKDELLFEGFEVDSASDGLAALEKVREFNPDVMLLDLALPGMNGFEVCKRLRPDMPNLWIIIVSVRGEEVDRVMGLELGADDYVTKPFSLREIVARVKVGLRRQVRVSIEPRYRFGDIELDLRGHRVTRNGNEVILTRTEFKILDLLVGRAGEVISRNEFLDAIWGVDFSITPRVIDTHITSLRRKLENDPANPAHILGVRGIGYKLNNNLS